MDRKPNLKEDLTHVYETTKRWLAKYPKNRDARLDNYKDEWYGEQCYGCQYYIKLQGYLRTDWGVCSHPESPFDMRLMFEHDGCEYFSPVDEDDEVEQDQE